MTYFKIGSKDFSAIVNELTIASEVNYNAQTNAAGNTVVDYINTKRVITVGFIPLDDTRMKELLTELQTFNVLVSFRNPVTNALEEYIECIVPSEEIQYYTIQINRVSYNAMTVDFIEL